MKVAVCGAGKCENHYIREWVEHYKDLGFDNVILYDNNDIDGEKFNEVIQDYIDSKFVIIKDKRGKEFLQNKFYNDCYIEYSNNYDWIAFFDIDEFLILENYSNIKDFLSQDKFQSFDYIRLCWKTYTDNNLVKVINEDYNCKSRFTEVFDKQNDPYNRRQKCIYKTNLKDVVITCHYPKPLLNPCNALGESITNKGTMLPYTVWKEAWLNHYLTKTLEEYIKFKCKKQVVPKDNENWYGLYYNNLHSFTIFWNINEQTEDKLNYINEYNKEHYMQ